MLKKSFVHKSRKVSFVIREQNFENYGTNSKTHGKTHVLYNDNQASGNRNYIYDIIVKFNIDVYSCLNKNNRLFMSLRVLHT